MLEMEAQPGKTPEDSLFDACQEQEVREQNVSCRGYAIQV